MRCADKIEIGTFEEFDILLCVMHRIGTPGQRINFVTADPGKLDTGSVHIQLSVPDLDQAEADIAFDLLQRLTVFLQHQHELVEIGLLGIPFQRMWHPRLDVHRVQPRFERSKGNLGSRVFNRFTAGIDELHGYGKTVALILIRVIKTKGDLQFPIPILLIQPRVNARS